MIRKNPPNKSGFFNPRAALAFFLCLGGVCLTMFSFVPPKPAVARGPMLASLRTDFTARPVQAALNPPYFSNPKFSPAVASPLTPTFGYPVISGIGGFGYEQDLRT